MHASTLTYAAGMTLAVAMLVLTSRLAGVKLPAPTEEQKAQTDLVKVKTTWGDKAAVFRTYKAQDKVAASYQTGGKAAYMQPGTPYVDPGSSVVPVPAASAPASTAKGWVVGSNVVYSLSSSTVVRSPSEP